MTIYNMNHDLPSSNNSLLMRIPSVHLILGHPSVKAILATEKVQLAVLKACLRLLLADLRREIIDNPGSQSVDFDTESIVKRLLETARMRSVSTLRPAINASGIVLHTGLGRARLSASAVKAVSEAASFHTLLELDEETGKRGNRQSHVSGTLCELTGADAACVVNNCAAAVVLAVTALASGKEVILSRGEMVEIGGSFRLPEIIAASGATLVEVGTTNRTRIDDYRKAVNSRTGLIVRCHPSNYKVVGYTSEASAAELVNLGLQTGVPVLDDQGTGSLFDAEALGLSGGFLKSVSASVSGGFDLIAASGDKLLGGPQAGILLGKQTIIDLLISHPLSRALRIDKLSLIALDATLKEYINSNAAQQRIPTLKYITRSLDEISRLAVILHGGLTELLRGTIYEVGLTESISRIGGGSAPEEELPTVCVCIQTRDKTSGADIVKLISQLRQASIPVIGRIHVNRLLLDPRTLEEDEIGAVIDMVAEAIGQATNRKKTAKP